MRELKFRAWDGEKMETDCCCQRIGSYHEPVDNRIMQWSGLRDLKGNEIYEDDLVVCYKDGKMIGVIDRVQFQNGEFMLRHRNISIRAFWFDLSEEHDYELEVVGNTYQHSKYELEEKYQQIKETTR